jgi:protein involved in polysaccharide export with SLBB domain
MLAYPLLPLPPTSPRRVTLIKSPMRTKRSLAFYWAGTALCLAFLPGYRADEPVRLPQLSTNAPGPSIVTLSTQPLLAVADMALLDDAQPLGKGDRISFRVIEDEEDPKPLTVTDSGDIEVPYYGLVRAEGKTSRQLAKEIKALLEKSYYYQATVIIAVDLVNKARVVGKVYVTGQVRSPGAQEMLASDTNTVSKAILKAGGFSDFADKRKVQIVRDAGDGGGGRKIFTVNVSDIWQKGQTDRDLVLQPEDQIFVPARLVNF